MTALTLRSTVVNCGITAKAIARAAPAPANDKVGTFSQAQRELFAAA
jgi:hypothetical protein